MFPQYHSILIVFYLSIPLQEAWGREISESDFDTPVCGVSITSPDGLKLYRERTTPASSSSSTPSRAGTTVSVTSSTVTKPMTRSIVPTTPITKPSSGSTKPDQGADPIG